MKNINISSSFRTLVTIMFVLFSSYILFGQPKIKFDSLEYTMTPVNKGERLYLKIPFKNIGNNYLIIERARDSNGVSVVGIPVDPIGVNKTGYITFVMPSDRVGRFWQVIAVYTNIDDNPIFLKINGQVLENISQERKVYGVVKDNLGEPIPGVNVIIKGTRRGISTDFDGKYALKVALNDTLEFSFVGMKTQKIKADKEEINIQFEEGVQLTEVLPYEPNLNPIKHKNLLTTITNEDIKNINNPKYNFKKNAKNNLFVIFVSELTAYDFNKEDLEFQQKYNVKYTIVGNAEMDYLIKFNKLTFKHLKKKYSSTWQNEIRKDALGLNIFINKK